MSSRKSKGVKQTMKGFLSGEKNLVQNLVCPYDETLFTGSSSSMSKQCLLLRHIEVGAESQQIDVHPIRFT
jgi:hypothetical protein